MYENVILIPYRNREENLNYFLNNSWGLIKANVNNVKLVIIQQEDGKQFNRGKLLNVGFKEYLNKTRYFITHDVDINPTKLSIKFYNTHHDIFVIMSAHKESFGGIVKFKNEVIIDINGFPNNIWGWGIEDRAIFFRSCIKKINYIFNTFENKTKNFNILKHKSNAETYKNEKKKYLIFGLRKI